MSIVVDLKARVIAPDREVYVARPGKGYKLYLNFVESGIVGPDLPFLDLIPGKPLGDHKDLDQRIRRSRAIRSWYRGKKEGAQPSHELKDYANTTDNSINSLRGTVSGFFEKLKIGDLVIVPPGAYSQEAFIGEVDESPTDYQRIPVPIYGNDPITGRGVTWLARIEKRRLPSSILDALAHPTSIYLLARSEREPIYEAAFKSYIDVSRKNADYTARFNVGSETYTTSADFLLTAFFNLIASNKKALDAGMNIKPDFHQAAFDELGSYAVDLRTNINSPGFLTLASKYSTPLIAAALFALAVQVGPNAAKELAAGRIIIGNSMAPAGDPCTAEVIAGTIQQLKLLGLTDEWLAACNIAKLAAGKAEVTSTVTIEQKP